MSFLWAYIFFIRRIFVRILSIKFLAFDASSNRNFCDAGPRVLRDRTRLQVLAVRFSDRTPHRVVLNSARLRGTMQFCAMKIKRVSVVPSRISTRPKERENLPHLSGMIVRDRRLVPICPTSGMRYPPIIVALTRSRIQPIDQTEPERGTRLHRVPRNEIRPLATFPPTSANRSLRRDRASLLHRVFPFRLLSPSVMPARKGWQDDVRNVSRREKDRQGAAGAGKGRSVGYYYHDGNWRGRENDREKRTRLVLLRERGVRYVS